MKPSESIGPKQNPYMLRWHLVRVDWLPRVYLHKFLRSDDDRALHDHPWWAVSIILRGGYVDVTETHGFKMMVKCRTSIFDVRSPFWKCCVTYQPATYQHRVALPRSKDGTETPCWTLFITGLHVRQWGFWCRDYHGGRRVGSHFVPAREFDGCPS